MPGPGAYDEEQKKTKVKSQCAFLGTGRRTDFVKSSAKNPGPGAYEVQDRDSLNYYSKDKKHIVGVSFKGKKDLPTEVKIAGTTTKVKQFNENERLSTMVDKVNKNDLMTLGKFGKDQRLNPKLTENPNPGPGAYDPNFKFKKLSQKIGTSHRADVAGASINFPGPGMQERKSAVSNVNWDNNNNFSTQQDVATHKFGQDKNRFKGPQPNPVGPGKYK